MDASAPSDASTVSDVSDVPDVFGLQPPEGFTSRPLDAWSLLELKPPGDPPG